LIMFQAKSAGLEQDLRVAQSFKSFVKMHYQASDLEDSFVRDLAVLVECKQASKEYPANSHLLQAPLLKLCTFIKHRRGIAYAPEKYPSDAPLDRHAFLETLRETAQPLFSSFNLIKYRRSIAYAPFREIYSVLCTRFQLDPECTRDEYSACDSHLLRNFLVHLEQKLNTYKLLQVEHRKALHIVERQFQAGQFSEEEIILKRSLENNIPVYHECIDQRVKAQKECSEQLATFLQTESCGSFLELKLM